MTKVFEPDDTALNIMKQISKVFKLKTPEQVLRKLIAIGVVAISESDPKTHKVTIGKQTITLDK